LLFDDVVVDPVVPGVTPAGLLPFDPEPELVVVGPCAVAAVALPGGVKISYTSKRAIVFRQTNL